MRVNVARGTEVHIRWLNYKVDWTDFTWYLIILLGRFQSTRHEKDQTVHELIDQKESNQTMNVNLNLCYANENNNKHNSFISKNPNRIQPYPDRVLKK